MTRNPTAAATLVLLTCLAPAPLRAQAPCETDPNQEVANCSFEAGDPPTSWSLVVGQGFQSSTAARSGAAAAQAGGEALGPAVFLLNLESSCFAATFGPAYGFGAHFTLESGSGVSCLAQIFWYPSAGCGSATSDAQGGSVSPSGGTWSQSSGVAAPTGSHGKLSLECVSASGDFVVRIDDAFAGPSLTTPVSLRSFAVE